MDESSVALSPNGSNKGYGASAVANRSSIVNALLSEEDQSSLHEIIKKCTTGNSCSKWDYHFHDNGMNKICNLFRVRPTSKNSGSVLEVRSSTSADILSFRVKYTGNNENVDTSDLQPVFMLIYS